jgi:site-specific DNA-methyltransferase (adenine-specific)
MKHSFLDGRIQLFNADCVKYLKTLSDNSVDIVVTDPPYFQVKKNAWDNQWPDVESFLSWLDEIVCELQRVLKPQGSLYLFCGSKLSADTELLIRQRLNVLNHIVWAKPSGAWRRMHKEDLRSFFPATERIIFAEQYGADIHAKSSAGYAQKCTELRQEVFQPLIDYFRDARAALKITAKEINEATGSQMCSHWFSASQWTLPNEKQYAALQKLFNEKATALGRSHQELKDEYITLSSDYEGLTRQYADLKNEYEHLRRYFLVTADVPYTDVWTFKPVAYYPGKHPCEKPADMLEHILQTSSREGDVVLDIFSGSGSTGKACIKLNRKFIGVELEKETYFKTVDDFKKL